MRIWISKSYLQIVPEHFLSVRTGLTIGNCYERCNNELVDCMSKPAKDPFAQSVNCQAGYDQCVNRCMAIDNPF